MARVAAKAAMSFEREKPVCILVGVRCAIHFQPDGLIICKSSIFTPRCSMSEQSLPSSKVPFGRIEIAPLHADVPEPCDMLHQCLACGPINIGLVKSSH